MEEFVNDEPEDILTEFDDKAEEGVLKILELEGVVYRNEFHYRLENAMRYQLGISEIFHQRTDAAIRRLEKEGKIVRTAPLGRPLATRKNPPLFYRLPEIPVFRPLHDEMRRKTECIDKLGSSSSGMGFYAQNLWTTAIEVLGFDIKGVNTNEYLGVKSETSGNLDIIAEFTGVPFGIDIKNGLSYPSDIHNKFMIAAEIGTIPLIIARNLSYSDRMMLYESGGLYKLYMHCIYDVALKASLEKCVEILGLPFVFIDAIDKHVLEHLISIISDFLPKINVLEKKLAPYRL